MIIEELKIENFQETIMKYIQNKTECMLYSFIPRNIVYKGKGVINEQYCVEHDYLIYPSIDFGGGIVATKNDLVVIIIKKDAWTLGNEIITKLIDYLSIKNINAKLVNNDIIIDDIYKSASFSSVNIGDGYIYTGIQCTFNPNVEDIKNICNNKPMKKIPKGLSEYGVYGQEILNLLRNKVGG